MARANRGERAANNAYGIPPNVLNLPVSWVGFPKASAHSAVVTKTQQTAGSSVAPGTDVDYPRNLVVIITPTASSAGVTGGGVTVYGRDIYGSTRSETFNSLAASSSVGQTGSLNFAKVDTISMQLSFLAATSSAASDFAVNVGVGQKLGLPVHLRSSDAIFAVHLGTLQKSSYSGATSTNNQWSVSTGDYLVNGLRLSDVYASGSALHIGYFALGFRAPRPSPSTILA